MGAMKNKRRATTKKSASRPSQKRSPKTKWPEIVYDPRPTTLTTEDAFAIGKVIVEQLYGGERSQARSERPTSVREIAKSLDGKFGQVTLNRCAAVYEMCRDLKIKPKFDHLRFAHLSRLTGLTEAQQKRLLKTAEKSEWSVERVQVEVKKLRAGKKRRKGRPPLPAFVKAIHQLDRFVDGREDLMGDIAEAKALETDKLKDLKSRVDTVLGQLQSAKTALTKALK
jgi:hypothetical protein